MKLRAFDSVSYYHIATDAESEDAAIELLIKLENVFTKGKFELRKWSNYTKQLLNHVSLEYHQHNKSHLKTTAQNIRKFLG